MSLTWAEVLQRYEERLDRCASLLDAAPDSDGADAGPPEGVLLDAWPPAGAPDGPLPPELRSRAEELLARSRELELRLTERRDALPRPATRPVGRQRRAIGFSSIRATL